jgi:hypothetical protein
MTVDSILIQTKRFVDECFAEDVVAAILTGWSRAQRTQPHDKDLQLSTVHLRPNPFIAISERVPDLGKEVRIGGVCEEETSIPASELSLRKSMLENTNDVLVPTRGNGHLSNPS